MSMACGRRGAVRGVPGQVPPPHTRISKTTRFRGRGDDGTQHARKRVPPPEVRREERGGTTPDELDEGCHTTTPRTFMVGRRRTLNSRDIIYSNIYTQRNKYNGRWIGGFFGGLCLENGRSSIHARRSMALRFVVQHAFALFYSRSGQFDICPSSCEPSQEAFQQKAGYYLIGLQDTRPLCPAWDGPGQIKRFEYFLF